MAYPHKRKRHKLKPENPQTKSKEIAKTPNSNNLLLSQSGILPEQTAESKEEYDSTRYQQFEWNDRSSNATQYICHLVAPQLSPKLPRSPVS